MSVIFLLISIVPKSFNFATRLIAGFLAQTFPFPVDRLLDRPLFRIREMRKTALKGKIIIDANRTGIQAEAIAEAPFDLVQGENPGVNG